MWSEATALVPPDYLQIISVDCSPAVLEVILQFLYTEKVDFDLTIAIDVLFAADLLFIEKLKTRAAMIISSLGSGGGEAAMAVPRDDVYDVPDSNPKDEEPARELILVLVLVRRRRGRARLRTTSSLTSRPRSIRAIYYNL